MRLKGLLLSARCAALGDGADPDDVCFTEEEGGEKVGREVEEERAGAGAGEGDRIGEVDVKWQMNWPRKVAYMSWCASEQ